MNFERWGGKRVSKWPGRMGKAVENGRNGYILRKGEKEPLNKVSFKLAIADGGKSIEPTVLAVPV